MGHPSILVQWEMEYEHLEVLPMPGSASNCLERAGKGKRAGRAKKRALGRTLRGFYILVTSQRSLRWRSHRLRKKSRSSQWGGNQENQENKCFK